MASLPAPLNGTRAAYVALHAVRTTGLEGDTLGFADTLSTVEVRPLSLGTPVRFYPALSATRSALEALSAARLCNSFRAPDSSASSLSLAMRTRALCTICGW